MRWHGAKEKWSEKREKGRMGGAWENGMVGIKEGWTREQRNIYPN